MFLKSHMSKNQQGFTLVEVVVALTVVAIGIMGLSIVFPTASRDVGKSGVRTKALQLAQEKMEYIHSLAYDDADLDGTYEHNDSVNPIDNVYYRTWTVYEDDPIAGCKRVVVEVTWDTYTQGTVSIWAVIASAGR
jgi:type IV pilus assembly protein PilV